MIGLAAAYTLRPAADWPLLLLLPFGVLLLCWLDRRAARRLAVLLGGRQDSLVGRPVFVLARHLLAALVVACLSVAWLRPVVAGGGERFGPDVVLCVDVSRSMLAADLSPSRWAVLQHELHQALADAAGSRVALLQFAGAPRLVAPLTADVTAIDWLGEELAPGTLPSAGSDLGLVIAAAERLLRAAGTLGDIVLLTDGGADSGADGDGADRAVQAARAAAANGHRVSAVGFGTAAGSKIVLGEGPAQHYLQDANGADVVTHLDAEALRRVTNAGEGHCVVAAAPAGLQSLWRDHLVPAAAQRRLADPDGGGEPAQRWWLLAGLLCWMLRLCLPERRA